MPAGSADPVDVLIFIIAGGVAIVLGGCAFVAVIEAWRRWSTNRKIREHLRN
jgi:hypothetical protein